MDSTRYKIRVSATASTPDAKNMDIGTGSSVFLRTLLGRGLLVRSQQQLEVTAGKGDAAASPDKRCSQSRRSSRASRRESADTDSLT